MNKQIIDLHNIHNWLVANKLTLNVMKTKYILFRTPHFPPPPSHIVLKIKNKEINRVSSISFLVVEFQEHLSWKTHI